jgi:ADP-Ribosyltransferase in polyvalent proteins
MIDWNKIEEDCTSLEKDCVPQNAREWDVFIKQYDNCLEYHEGRGHDFTFDGMTEAERGELVDKHMYFGKGYKKSVFECCQDLTGEEKEIFAGVDWHAVNLVRRTWLYEDIYLAGLNLKSLPKCPNYVNGSFRCEHNRLTSLEGASKYVDRSFFCEHNKLTSLEGAPKYVGNNFYCAGNNLPKSIPDQFYRSDLHKYVGLKESFVMRWNEFVNESNHAGGSYVVWHGTDKTFDRFDSSQIGSGTGSAWNGIGFYFSDSEAEAGLYGDNLIKCRIRLANPFDMTKIRDTSCYGSGVARALASLDLYDKSVVERLNIVESKYDRSLVQVARGKGELSNVWMEYDGREYASYNRSKDELDDKNIKNIYVLKVLQEAYGITLPQKISDVCGAGRFTAALKRHGYDGVVADNSTVPSGHEYVVFDPDAIEIIK